MEGAASNLEKLKDLMIIFKDFYSTLRGRIRQAVIFLDRELNISFVINSVTNEETKKYILI